jgi:hypothetical protein
LWRVLVSGTEPPALGVPAHPVRAPLDCAEPCAGVELDAPLAARTLYKVGATLAFTTGDAADHVAPQVLEPSTRREGSCVIVTAQADEPVSAALVDPAGAVQAASDVPHPQVELSMLGDAKGVGLVVRDQANNPTPVELHVPPAAPNDLAITEVMAHPLGAQPAQEWVEIYNRSGHPVATEGLVVAAGGASESLPAARIAPGAYALIVGHGFVRDDGVDRPVPAEVPLLRLGHAAIGRGLVNRAGGVIEVGRAGAVWSRYGASLDPKPGLSVVRSDVLGCDVTSNWHVAEHPTPGAAEAPP